MKSILLDTNLFLLLIAGLCDTPIINRHKRLSNFTKEDFYLLTHTINRYERLLISSHCTAEVSNLIRQTSNPDKENLMLTFAEILKNCKESHIEKSLIIKDPFFVRLGTTDTGLIIKSKRSSCLLTVDHDLHQEALRKNRNSINFNHIRDETTLV